MQSENNVYTVEQSLGNIIGIIQKIKGIKNTDFQVYGISSSMLSQFKSGTRVPSIEKLFQLSEGLHVPVSTIMGFVEDQQKNKNSSVKLMGKICDKIDELDRKENEYREELARLKNSL